jgi:hypothetical protein
MDQLIYLAALVFVLMVAIEVFHIGKIAAKNLQELVALNAKISQLTGILARGTRPAAPQPDDDNPLQPPAGGRG